MKKIVLTAAFSLIVATGVAFGQETKMATENQNVAKLSTSQKGGEMPNKMKKKWEMMKKELNLTPEQEVKIQSMYEKNAMEMKEMMSSNNQVDKEKMKEEMKAKHEQNEKELQQILTPEQYTKWKGMMEQKKSKHHKMTPQELIK